MFKKLVSIVIVTYNRQKIVLDCLRSVFKMNYPHFEVILVDNHSQDNTLQAVGNRFPLVKLVALKTNLGLNQGKNLGQKRAKGDYILFLDSDTIVDKSLLTELVKLAESDHKIGIVCPKMYYSKPKDVIWYAGSSVNLLTSHTRNLGTHEKDKGQFDQIRETQFAPTAYLATKKIVKKLKGHNEKLFMTYGDTDYGFRARKLGFKIIFCPKAKLWHKLEKSENIKTVRALGYNLPMRAYYFSRNRVIFMKAYAPKLNFIIFILFFFPLFTLYISYKIIIFKGGWQFLKPHLQGSWDGLKYVFNNKVENNW